MSSVLKFLRYLCWFFATSHACIEWIITWSYENTKELLSRNKHDIWSFSDCNGIRTNNHLVRKQALNHLASLIECKWLSICLKYLVSWRLNNYRAKIHLTRNNYRVKTHLIHVRSITKTYSIHHIDKFKYHSWISYASLAKG